MVHSRSTQHTGFLTVMERRVGEGPCALHLTHCHRTLGSTLQRGFHSGGSDQNLSVTQETWVQTLGQEDLLEHGMATHSIILSLGNPMDRHEEIRDEPRGWGHRPNAPDSPVRS